MAAPKGNKYALGNSGQSKRWTTPEELQIDIDNYFMICDSNVMNKTNNGVEITEPYTIEGLALALDCHIDTLRNYQKKEGYEEFFATITRAKLRIQKQKVINGLTRLTDASITKFDLQNNHGYKDKQEIETKDVSDNKVKIEFVKTNDKV